MRLGARVVLCLLALSLAAGSGCRKPLNSNIDRNEAPETWITAAPVDTLTVRDQYGRPIGNPAMTTIPVSFHLYWAGSDKDGAVAGFYYAVVETTATPTDNLFARLPGPKPGDYHFTTKTDTTFVFTVSELYADRQHAFFIYSVDNLGKVDPTPARFVFKAFDEFPPQPVIDLARASGTIVRLTANGDPVPEFAESFMNTEFVLGGKTRDTVAALSRLDFRWHSEVRVAGSYVTGYRYKLDESQFQDADSSVHSKSYGTGLPEPGGGPVAPGTKIFTLRALDQAGGAGTTTRYFIMNFSPDTWWAGPDPAAFTGPSDGEYDSHSVDVLAWPNKLNPVFVTNPPLPAGSTFGPDSFLYRPSKRLPPNRDFNRPGTFYEVYKNRLYARTEGDTVHMNSYVILWNGGYDKDSRYQIRADTTDPFLKQKRPDGTDEYITGPVIDTETQYEGRAGSPIGFRSVIVTKLTPADLRVVPAQTSIYPVYEPASVFRAPRLGGYWRTFQAGKAYALARAEDSDGGLDNSVIDPVKLVDDGNADWNLRRKVLVFYVDKAPALVRDDRFRPRDGQSITSPSWDFVLQGMDLDPFDPTVVSPSPGGPTTTTITRFKITLYGKSVYTGEDTSWTYLDSRGLPYINLGPTPPPFSFIPGGTMDRNPFASGQIRISIQICDCIDCELAPGQGRCVDGIDPRTGQVLDPQNVITVNYTRPVTKPDLGTHSQAGGGPGPDPVGQERVR